MAKAKKQPPVKKEAVDSFIPGLVGESFASNGYARMGKSRLYDGDNIVLNNLGKLERPFSTFNDSYLTAREPIKLCQIAYDKIPVFRTSVDILADLCNTDIHLKGGNSQSNKFFGAWLNKIGQFKLKDQFFREAFRSSNIFFQRIDARLEKSDILAISQNYAESQAKTINIPSRYILLNPADICVNSIAYDQPCYYRIISKLELEHMKNTGDEGDRETYQSIKQAIEKYVSAGPTEPLVQLDPKKLHICFYQKQDYDPFAVPMGYCVLDEINLKLEFKKGDAILARSIEYAMLLVTNGAEEEKGGINPIAINAIKSSFQNQKIGRVLVSDYTTEAKFVIPEIGTLIGPEKYVEINESIANGMMNIFFGQQKYADSVNKLRALGKKITNAQQFFLTEFLNPEIRRISKLLNFKSYPVATMEAPQLEDQANSQRVWAQLIQMGILSPKEAIELFDTGIFPSYDDVLTNQEEFRTNKDKGYFQPIQGGPFEQEKLAEVAQETALKKKAMSKPAGRPGGTRSPQTTKKVSQVGASFEGFSAQKLAKNTLKFYALKDSYTESYKEHYGLKRLTKFHKEAIDTSISILTKSEKPEKWLESVASYLTITPDKITLGEADSEIAGITVDYDVDFETATILYHSKL
jgi:hypothetical protein